MQRFFHFQTPRPRRVGVVTLSDIHKSDSAFMLASLACLDLERLFQPIAICGGVVKIIF